MLWLISAVFFVIALTHFQNYFKTVSYFGDNDKYISGAEAIQHWDLRSSRTKQGWGLPYLIALLSKGHLPDEVGLLFICGISSIAAIMLVRSLWGPWIAAFFALSNLPWIQTSLLGGSEPLFALLLFSSFWFNRKQYSVVAWSLAALATWTRPVGVFALLALGMDLVLRREYRKLAICATIASLIGLIYLVPFWVAFHDPLYQFHRYQHADWESGSLLSWPFHIIVVSYVYYTGPWTNVVLTGGWIALSAVALFRMGLKWYRKGPPEYPNEQIFAITYLMFLFCYNSLEWARWGFPRFVIPAIPLVFLSIDRWLPKSRYVIYPLCIASSILAAFSAIGIQNVFSTLRHGF